MNTFYIVVFGIAWLVFAYFWYGNIIKKKLLKSDDSSITPSQEINDGTDFVPTNKSILFGHHFSSIAGAGPIVGPILAFALFGWLPAVLWILIGSVFIGAVHDYATLMISVRNKGKSIVNIADKIISKKSKAIFSSFVWITLTLIQAVFADLTAKTLDKQPEIAIPTIGILVLAVLFGWLVNKKGLNVVAGTVAALVVLFALVPIGQMYPIDAGYHTWLIAVMIYSFVAATLPVWVLLQPRDYISMYILIIGLALGFGGIMILQPEINAPALTSFDSSKGPMFPMLFIIIACGAVSGFHSIVASGTSSKQLKIESDGKRIAYGGMLTEAALALLVIMMISSVLVWDDGSGVATGLPVFQDFLGQSAIIVFGMSLGLTLESLGIPIALGSLFGMLMLKAFILTTLDTSARLNRYIVQETLGHKYGGIFNNKYFAVGASLIIAYILCMANGYKVLWPMFGASNQLIATLTLFVITVYLFGHKAPGWYTLIPGIFMLIVTESALFYQAIWVYLPNNDYHLSVISIFLFVLGLVVAFESIGKIRVLRGQRKS